jgi:para-nitrobenzyl esterase
MRSVYRIAAAIGGAAFLAMPGWSETTVVSTISGAVEGVAQRDVISFKGIPFAAPPVGALRWRAPLPAASWSGIRSARDFGHDCMQLPFPSDAAPLGTAPSEDCLVVNVWRPAAVARKKPVLVWIYGGGFVNGGSSPAVYDGSAFAKQGIVFVSFNYRLGRFGFFAHPALTAAHEGALANYGLMDQIAALRWIQRNIASFGGDPEQVTVMGESAGGVSVLDLMSSPSASGLFKRAIIMSGGGRTLVDSPSMPKAEQVGVNFARSVGITGDGASALAALRALPAEQVRGDLNLASKSTGEPPLAVRGPILDGETITQSEEAAMEGATAAHIPVIIGTTGADISSVSAATKDALFAGFGKAAARVRAAYDPAGTASLSVVAADISRDRLMTEPARFVAARTRVAGQSAWLYRFSYVASAMRGTWSDAPHATDIPYFFNTVLAKYGAALSAKDAQAAHLANGYLVNFVKTGTPNGPGLPEWSAFDPTNDAVLMISADATAQSVADPLKSRLDAIEPRLDVTTP